MDAADGKLVLPWLSVRTVAVLLARSDAAIVVDADCSSRCWQAPMLP